MKNLKDLQLDELEQLMVSLGEAKFRAKQIFGWLYSGSETFEDMSNIPAALKRKLQDAGWGTGSFKAEKYKYQSLTAPASIFSGWRMATP